MAEELAEWAEEASIMMENEELNNAAEMNGHFEQGPGKFYDDIVVFVIYNLINLFLFSNSTRTRHRAFHIHFEWTPDRRRRDRYFHWNRPNQI